MITSAVPKEAAINFEKALQVTKNQGWNHLLKGILWAVLSHADLHTVPPPRLPEQFLQDFAVDSIYFHKTYKTERRLIYVAGFWNVLPFKTCCGQDCFVLLPATVFILTCLAVGGTRDRLSRG